MNLNSVPFDVPLSSDPRPSPLIFFLIAAGIGGYRCHDPFSFRFGVFPLATCCRCALSSDLASL